MKIYDLTRRSLLPLLMATAALVLFCNYLIFLGVPNEKIMGAVQRIFYFHVAAAVATYAALGILLISALIFLARRDEHSVSFGVAASEVGLLFCSITLISGMIWGHSAWNTWFSWEPRLVTFLVLWLILLGANIFRGLADPTKVDVHSAVLWIVSALNVPLVHFSIKFLPQSAQLHPQVVARAGGLDPAFVPPLLYSMLAFFMLLLLLVSLRYRIELLERRSRYGTDS